VNCEAFHRKAPQWLVECLRILTPKIAEAQPFSRPLARCIIISPATEAGWLDILLAQQRGYLRTMINRVVEGLDQHDDAPSVIAPGKMEDLAQVPLLRDGDQLFSQPPQSTV
jgi:hypothetical protein